MGAIIQQSDKGKSGYTKFRFIEKLSLLSELFQIIEIEKTTAMVLKYQSEIDKLTPDFSTYQEFEERISFRWVFENIDDWRNYAPRYLILKDRDKSQDHFEGWALSFFEQKSKAINRIAKISRGKMEIYKKLGTHVAKCILNGRDGISEIKCNSSGHFNHFEYEKVSLKGRFDEIEPMIKQ